MNFSERSTRLAAAHPGSLATLASAVLLSACSSPAMTPGDYHLRQESRATLAATAPENDAIPAVVAPPMLPPPPRQGPNLETYSVVVNDLEISELLFAMARDAKINVDVHPRVKGLVTINAVEQTLPQILSRLSRQVDLRYEFDGQNLVVTPDDPFLKHYPIDYVNITRESRANTSIATQISSTGGSALSDGGEASASNNSTTSITNVSRNQFWTTLVSSIEKIISDGQAPASAQDDRSSSNSEGSDAAGNSASGPSEGTSGNQASSETAETLNTSKVIANPESSMISVWATERRQARVQEYIDRTLKSARRQVLIEATIAEVQLSEDYQQGINWQKLRLDGTGFSFTQQPNGTTPLNTGYGASSGPGGVNFSDDVTSSGSLPGAGILGTATSSMGVLRYLRSSSSGNIGLALSLLQSFGKVKVLSSPKISVLNNQTAVLKVVDNRIYFTIDVQVTPGTNTSAPLVTYTSTPNTVPVGFVMSVTPQIKDTGAVTMNVRPTISRIIGFVNDPNPALAQNNVVSQIPEIQTREIESILKVNTGDVAVMGGLMQESIDDQTDSIPGPGNLPFLGELFRYRKDSSTKSELVIFLRPIVIEDASIEGDYRGFKSLLPDQDFFTKPSGQPVPRTWRSNTDADASTTNAGANQS